MFTNVYCQPKVNNCFSIIFKCEHKKVENNELKRDKQHTENVT